MRGATQIAARLRAQRSDVLLWRQLTTIAVNAPISTAHGFLRQPSDRQEIHSLMQQLRFGPITQRRIVSTLADTDPATTDVTRTD